MDREYSRTGRPDGPVPHDEPKCDQPQDMACQDTARTLLDRTIDATRRKLNNLVSLSAALPMVLPPEADQALYDMLCDSRRRFV